MAEFPVVFSKPSESEHILTKLIVKMQSGESFDVTIPLSASTFELEAYIHTKMGAPDKQEVRLRINPSDEHPMKTFQSLSAAGVQKSHASPLHAVLVDTFDIEAEYLGEVECGQKYSLSKYVYTVTSSCGGKESFQSEDALTRLNGLLPRTSKRGNGMGGGSYPQAPPYIGEIPKKFWVDFVNTGLGHEWKCPLQKCKKAEPCAALRAMSEQTVCWMNKHKDWKVEGSPAYVTKEKWYIYDPKKMMSDPCCYSEEKGEYVPCDYN